MIIVNSNNGSDSTECCVNGTCTCSSLSTALLNIDNNTIINITSESVALNNTTTMGSGKLTNITITGSNVTIMCNNSGSVYCESCDDVMIEGITWDTCGDPYGTNIAGVTFNGTSNISLVNCTFQHSQLSAVSLLEVSENVLIQDCNFLSNIQNNVGVLNITRVSSFQFSNNSNIIMTIIGGYFYNSYSGIPPLNIYIVNNSSVSNCSVLIKRTTFISNQVIFFLQVEAFKLINIQLTEISAFNNSLYNVGFGACINLFSTAGDVFVSIISSNFKGNNGSNVRCSVGGSRTSIIINNSNFTDSGWPKIREMFPTVYISCTTNNTLKIMFYKVQFNNNLNPSALSAASVDRPGTVCIIAKGGDVKVSMFMVNFVSNKYFGHNGGVLTILLPNQNDSDYSYSILIKGCRFVRNRSAGHGAALYIDAKNDKGNIQITNTIFDQNTGASSIIYLQGSQSFLSNNQPVKIFNSNFTNNVGSAMYLLSCNVYISGILLFKNNTALYGGAMYLSQKTTVTFDNKATVHFIGNKARINGGAIYVDLECIQLNYRYNNIDSDTFRIGSDNIIMFTNNSANTGYNSIYFNMLISLYHNCAKPYRDTGDPRSIFPHTMSVQLFSTS